MWSREFSPGAATIRMRRHKEFPDLRDRPSLRPRRDCRRCRSEPHVRGAATTERLVLVNIQVDAAGRIVPWSSPKPSIAYDQAIRAVWRFWSGMPMCPNGVRYFMQHQVWKPGEEDRTRPRRRPAGHGALVLEPAACLPGRPGARQPHAVNRRLLPGAWTVIAQREVAASAIPVQHDPAQRLVRWRHARRQGLSAAGQGRLVRRGAGDARESHW